jgi:hypothetical protein
MSFPWSFSQPQFTIIGLNGPNALRNLCTPLYYRQSLSSFRPDPVPQPPLPTPLQATTEDLAFAAVVLSPVASFLGAHSKSFDSTRAAVRSTSIPERSNQPMAFLLAFYSGSFVFSQLMQISAFSVVKPGSTRLIKARCSQTSPLCGWFCLRPSTRTFPLHSSFGVQ